MSPREPLVLIHGLLDDSGMWEHQARCLEPYADIVTPDILQQESVEAAAEHVISSIGGPFALGGFSMGGYIAFEILRRAPERIRRLALINTSARVDTPERIAEQNDAIHLASSGGFERLVAEELPTVVHPSRLDDDELMGRLGTMARRVGAAAYCRQHQICMTRPDSRPLLGTIACPTLVITGRQNALVVPELSVEMADAIPGASLVVIDDCSHYAPMERPWAVTALLQQWFNSR